MSNFRSFIIYIIKDQHYNKKSNTDKGDDDMTIANINYNNNNYKIITMIIVLQEIIIFLRYLR